MILFNFLFGFISVFSSLTGAEGLSDGWFPVESPRSSVSESVEEDPSIWVVFAKKIRDEKFLVRFPKDPTYRYTSDVNLEISSSKEGERFHLWVQDRGLSIDPFEERVAEVLTFPEASLISRDASTQDLVYRLGGKWVREHIALSSSHLFVFQTASEGLNEKNHQKFVASFQLE